MTVQATRDALKRIQANMNLDAKHLITEMERKYAAGELTDVFSKRQLHESIYKQFRQRLIMATGQNLSVKERKLINAILDEIKKVMVA